jgi:hypothetical protein
MVDSHRIRREMRRRRESVDGWRTRTVGMLEELVAFEVVNGGGLMGESRMDYVVIGGFVMHVSLISSQNPVVPLPFARTLQVRIHH